MEVSLKPLICKGFRPAIPAKALELYVFCPRDKLWVYCGNILKFAMDAAFSLWTNLWKLWNCCQGICSSTGFPGVLADEL